ncbi:hypothetical protein [Ekhidna sp.]|uniref:hypothetical protein n=1 Tax=Ekhidna sp. TaxID=2608089 RepID=UPI003CCC08EC
MIRKIFSYLPDNSFGIYFIGSLLFFLLIATAIYVTSGELYNSLLIAGIIAGLTFVATSISEVRGRKKHRTILEGRLFTRLCAELGFQKEHLNNNQYFGLKGVYDQYFFRIYYNWNTSLPGRMFDREICMMIYIEPPTKADKSLDLEHLNSISSKYDTRDELNPNYQVFVAPSYIAINRGFTFLTSYRNIVDKLDQLIQIAIDENLQPIDESWVQRLIDEDEDRHGPLIETFYKQ